jgi:esterase/lipase superfamily enzyme
MYFITNKTVEVSGENLKFQESNEISQSLRYCMMIQKEEFKEIGSKSFMKTLMNAPEKEILFYVHGFNNQPYSDVFPRAKSMQNQLNDAKLDRIMVVPIIWPCDNDFGIIKDYWDDQDSAEETGRVFARAISKLIGWQDENQSNPCMKRMHVFAHSMGGRVLVHCLHHWANNFGGGGVPYLFKNVFLMASDIPNESLEANEQGKYIPESAQRVISYYANDDFSMPASKISNMRNKVFSRRIGHTGPKDMTKVPDNVYAVNCDSFNNKFDTPKGHSYFIDKKDMKSPAFQHVIKTLRARNHDLGKRKIVLKNKA